MKNVKQAMLECQDFIAPVAPMIKKETKKAVNAGPERVDRHEIFFAAVYSTVTRSASSGDRPLTDISEERTHRMAYSEMSKEQVPDLPPCSDVTAVNKSSP